MSEYQYYEFQAVDRPLTEKEMGELRSLSTRARITPTSFVNDYSWSDLKGDEDAWVEKYFDAFLYLANWGTHVFKLRLPARLLDAKTARLYCAGERASVREKNGRIILTFVSEDEEAGDWVEGDGQLSSLISVRVELARGDFRGLYLGWLLCAQSGDIDDDEFEPPVPAGLAKLSASLESLVEFLRIDTDLVGVAASASPPLDHAEPKPAEVREWLTKLPVAEKDDLLTRLIAGNDSALANELVQRMRHERGGDRGVTGQSGRRGASGPRLHAPRNRTAPDRAGDRTAASIHGPDTRRGSARSGHGSRRMRRLSSGSPASASIKALPSLNRRAIAPVPALPTESHTILGGAPRRKLSCRKSSSLETMMKPCSRACAQISASGFPCKPTESTCALSG
jgi:hypothetical protein